MRKMTKIRRKKHQVCSVRDQDPAANSLMEQISDLEDEEEEEEYGNR